MNSTDPLPSANKDGTTSVELLQVDDAGDEIPRAPRDLLPVIGAFFAISLITTAVSLGAIGPPSVLAFVLQDIGESDASNASWALNAANVMQAAAGAPIAFITDIYGRKITTLICLVFGVIGPLVASRANSTGQLIAGQAMNGIALAIIPVAYAIASEVVPRRWRGPAQYFLAFFASVGAIIGTLCSSAFVETGREGWRDIFYLLAGLYGVSFFGILFAYMPASRRVQFKTQHYTLRDLDYLGYALLMGGIVLFLTGLTYGGHDHSWSSGIVLGPLISGAILLGACALYEWKGTTTGLFDHTLFRERNFGLSMAAIFFEALLLFAFAALYAQEIASIFASNPVQQGLRTVPFWIAGLVMSFPLGFIAHRISDPRWIMCGGFAGYAIAAIMLANAKLSSDVLLFAADSIAGVAYLGPLTFAIAIAQFSAARCLKVILIASLIALQPPLLIGTASALASTCRALGASLSTAMFTTIFVNKLDSKLPAALMSEASSLGLSSESVLAQGPLSLQVGSSAPFLAIPGVSSSEAQALYEAAARAALDSYQYVWIVVCPFAAFAIFVTLFLQSIEKNLTDHIDAPIRVHADAVKVDGIK